MHEKLSRSDLSQYFSLTDLTQIFPYADIKASCQLVPIKTVPICNMQKAAEETLEYSNTRLVTGKSWLLQTAY